MVTSFLRFCRAGNDGLALALAAGVLGVDCAAGVGTVYTWSVEGVASCGLLVA